MCRWPILADALSSTGPNKSFVLMGTCTRRSSKLSHWLHTCQLAQHQEDFLASPVRDSHCSHSSQPEGTPADTNTYFLTLVRHAVCSQYKVSKINLVWRIERVIPDILEANHQQSRDWKCLDLKVNYGEENWSLAGAQLDRHDLRPVYPLRENLQAYRCAKWTRLSARPRLGAQVWLKLKS